LARNRPLSTKKALIFQAVAQKKLRRGNNGDGDIAFLNMILAVPGNNSTCSDAELFRSLDYSLFFPLQGIFIPDIPA